MDKLPPKTIHSTTTSVSEGTDKQQMGSYQHRVVKELSPKPEELPPSDTDNKPLADTKASIVTDKAPEDDEEVKSKPEAAKISPAELPLDPETLKQAFLEMPWQDNPENHEFIERVALKINKAITAFTLTTTEPEKAYGYFQKAVICHRSGKTREALLSLEIAIHLDPETVREQLELATALLFFSKPSDDYAQAFGQFLVIGKHRQKNSLMAHLKIAELAVGLYPDFKIPISPTSLGRLLVEVHENCFLGQCFPEALYTNDLELSYLVPYPLFALKGHSAGDRLVGDQLLWAIMDAVGKNKEMELPGCHKKGMGSNLYDSYSRVVVILGLARKDEPLRKTVPRDTLLELRRRLLELKRIKYSNPITYTEALGALLLGLAHHKQLVEDPSNKVAADCYLAASNHPALKELLIDAARQYEKVMCYRNAADCQKALAEHLSAFPAEVEKLMEDAEDNLKRAEDYDLLLQAVEQLSLESEEAAAGTKTKKKKKRRARPKPSLVSEQDNPDEPLEEKVLPASPVAAEEVKTKKKSKKVAATLASAPTSIGSFEEWDFTTKQFLKEIYYARRHEDFALQKTVFNQAKARVSAVPESCEIFIESAWHHLHQIDLELKDRVTLNEKGEPAELEQLCHQARKDLAKAFQRLTGLKISHSITPETMKRLLQQHYPCPLPVPEEQKRFRYCLRKIMSSFGHSYSYMADKHPADKLLGHYVREFYNLKKVANPEYSKTTPLMEEGKVRLVSRRDFDIMQQGIRS